MSDWIKVEKEIGTDTKVIKETALNTRISRESGIDTKVVKVEDQESREMSWLDFGEKTHTDIADWTWFDLLIFTALWTKIEKESGDWEKVDR